MTDVVVMRFDHASVADAPNLRDTAQRVIAAKESGVQVVAVFPPRASTFTDLVAMAGQVSARPDPREMDMLLSTADRQACALAAMAISATGHRAISLTATQAGIVTDTAHTNARIVDARVARIHSALSDGQIVLVGGYGGLSTESAVTTLGRGGADTVAVVLAAALGARVCEIYSERAGIRSADPTIVASARPLPLLSFSEMREFAEAGADVPPARALECARANGVRIHCRPLFEDGPGTLVLDRRETMERPPVTAVLHTFGRTRLTLATSADPARTLALALEALSAANIRTHGIVYNATAPGGQRTEINLLVADDTADDAGPALEAAVTLPAKLTGLGVVSVVGTDLQADPAIAARAIGVLSSRDIGVHMVVGSDGKISCAVDASQVDVAVRTLHAAFGLDDA